MKTFYLIILLLFLFPVFTFSQNLKDENELISSMCKEFQKTEHLSDSLRVQNTYLKFLPSYLEKIEPAKLDSVGSSIYFRLQRECESFRRFLDRVDPLPNWKEIKEMPKSELTVKDRKEFEKTKNFYYLEGNNETTNVVIENGIWMDIFPDNTFSKTKFKWYGKDNEFELEFIESTNLNRKGYSRKGDKYFYKIIRKEKKYFEVAAQIPNQEQILLFKLYIK